MSYFFILPDDNCSRHQELYTNPNQPDSKRYDPCSSIVTRGKECLGVVERAVLLPMPIDQWNMGRWWRDGKTRSRIFTLVRKVRSAVQYMEERRGAGDIFLVNKEVFPHFRKRVRIVDISLLYPSPMLYRVGL